MAKLVNLLAAVAAMLVLVTLTEVQGQSRNKIRVGKGQGRGRHSSHPSERVDKSQSHRKKQMDQGGKQLLERHRNRPNNFFLSYHVMNPPSFFNFRWNRDATRDEPWWQGANVCQDVSEETVNITGRRSEMMRHFSTNSQVCDESDSVYKCKIVQENTDSRRVLTIVYECCHGYTRQRGHYGCPEKINLLTLMETAEELALTDFLKAVRTMKLTKELEKGNFTIFVPVNGAFTFDGELLNSEVTGILMKDAPEVIPLSGSPVGKAMKMLRNLILSHVVEGTMKTSNMEDEQILETGRSGDTTIRINYFSRPEKLMTVNCVPVVSRDHMATNGVIHSVEKVLKPVTDTLVEIVKSRHDLSTLKTVLTAANYISKLDQSGEMTLLAPTNLAFDKMNKRLKEKLLSGDTECLERVLQNHLLPNVICSVAIQGQARTTNHLHRFVNLSRAADNKLFIDVAQVLQADVMGTNGVMHVIDTVLVPDEALSVLDLLNKQGYREFLRLVEKAGLTKTLDKATNITVFVPTNEAIRNLHVAVKTKLNEDSKLLKDVVTFHLSPEIQECRRSHDNKLIPTLAGTNIRLNSYSMFPYHHHGVKTAQCVPLSDVSVNACNGVINVIKAVMMPPKGNVLDTLTMDKRFSTLVSLVKKSGIADNLQGDGPFTVLAPNNEAFEKVGKEAISALVKDPERLKKVIESYIIEGTLCCAGIFQRHSFGRFQVRTMSGDLLRLSRDHGNRPRIGQALVTACDQTATNGNVLEINRVMSYESPRLRWRIKRLSSWDLPRF